MWRTWRPASTGCCRYYIQADVIYLPYVLTDCMFLVFVFSWNEPLFSLFYPSGPEDCDAALSGPHVPPQRPCADRALSAVWSHSPPRLPLVRVSLMIQTTHFYPEIFNSSVNRGQHLFVFSQVWEKASPPTTLIASERPRCLWSVWQCRKSRLSGQTPARWTLPVSTAKVSTVWWRRFRLGWR